MMEIVQFLQGSPIVFALIVGLFGLMVGSFLNVVILRLPVMLERQWRAQCHELLHEGNEPASPATGHETDRLDLIAPRSRCPQCGHRIKAWENIPVVSYMLLRGRCSACGTRISPRYPIIEAATALLSVAVAWHLGFTWETLAALTLTWALISLSVIDFDHQLLPDNITLPFLWAGLTLSLFGLFVDTQSAVIGALAGYLSLWGVFWLFKLLTGKEGMGYGDFKLLAMLGAWQGWQFVLPIVLLSSIVGAVVGVALIMFRGQQRNIPIPFGPYLATAGWITLLWGHDLMDAYWRWMGVS